MLRPTKPPSKIPKSSAHISDTSYVKISKKGSIIPTFTDKYLKHAIPCGISSCSHCPEGVLTQLPILIPDTNIILHEYDFISHTALPSIVIVQTVLEEVQNLNLYMYDKLRQLIRSRPAQYYVFTNETFTETYVERHSNETSNDRNDRAIRTAALWYKNHLSQPVFLITNDTDNKNKAAMLDLEAFSVEDFLLSSSSSFPPKTSSELLDRLHIPDKEPSSLDKERLFEDHLDINILNSGLESGKFHKGLLTISPYNIFQGSIVATVHGLPSTIFICGADNLNRAIHNDIIAVELIEGSKDLLSEYVTLGDNSASILKDSRLASAAFRRAQRLLSSEEKCLYFGKVVGVFSRPFRRICGSFSQPALPLRHPESSFNWYLFSPVDKKFPSICVRSNRPFSELVFLRFQITIDGWPSTSPLPRGHITELIGTAGDTEVETRVILMENDIPFAPFSAKALACLPVVEPGSTQLSVDVGGGRLDLRSLDTICSIDPPGCTDIDDALHAILLDNGHIQVGIHIADVSHFVAQGTPLDVEAANRGTTVYLTDRRIDMLPEILGSNLCSLMADVDRYALSCLIEMDQEANVNQVSFVKSIIRSSASLTYAQAQALIDYASEEKKTPSNKETKDPPISDQLADSILLLYRLSHLLRKKRVEAGALTLASSEIRFEFEAEEIQGVATDTRKNPLGLIHKSPVSANFLVEEFMLLANVEAAKLIYSSFPDQALLRRHPSPPMSNFIWLNDALKACGLPVLDPSTSLSLATSLDVVDNEFYHGKGDPSASIIRMMVTRSMMQATYFSSGSLPSSTGFWHYGLATPIYTHFTSPIRRYADLVVHRLISLALSLENTSLKALSRVDLERLTTILNHRHRRAQIASRASCDLFVSLYLENTNTTPQYEARVVRVALNGLIIFIVALSLELFISFTTDIPDTLSYDSEGMSWRSSSTDRILVRIFDLIVVKIIHGRCPITHAFQLRATWIDPPDELTQVLG